MLTCSCCRELADAETAALALAAAETGRLVLVGVSAGSARDAVARVCELWEPHERPGVRARLGVALRGVLHQRLVVAKSGKGRTAAAELLSGADAAAPRASPQPPAPLTSRWQPHTALPRGAGWTSQLATL